MSLLVLCKILRLFLNTLTADDKCSVLNEDYFKQPIQVLVSRKQKAFSQFFSAFLKSTLNFEHFQKKDVSHSRGISEITDSAKSHKMNVYKLTFQRTLQQPTW